MAARICSPDLGRPTAVPFIFEKPRCDGCRICVGTAMSTATINMYLFYVAAIQPTTSATGPVTAVCHVHVAKRNRACRVRPQGRTAQPMSLQCIWHCIGAAPGCGPHPEPWLGGCRARFAATGDHPFRASTAAVIASGRIRYPADLAELHSAAPVPPPTDSLMNLHRARGLSSALPALTARALPPFARLVFSTFFRRGFACTPESSTGRIQVLKFNARTPMTDDGARLRTALDTSLPDP
jgi:hypothetical protein